MVYEPFTGTANVALAVVDTVVAIDGIDEVFVYSTCAELTCAVARRNER